MGKSETTVPEQHQPCERVCVTKLTPQCVIYTPAFCLEKTYRLALQTPAMTLLAACALLA